MAAVSFGFLSARSPTFCTDWACTALHLRDVDHLGGGARLGLGHLVVGELRQVGDVRQRGLRGGLDRLVRRDDAADHRAHHHEQHHQGEEEHDAQLDGAHDVVLGELQHRPDAGRLVERCERRVGKAQVDDLDLVAALLVVADRRAHQHHDAVEILLRSRLVDGLALLVLGVDAVDQHRDRDAVDAAALDHPRLGGARDVVVDGLVGLLGQLARRRVLPVLVSRQLVLDRDLALILLGGGILLARLRRAHHAAVGIKLVRGLGDAVEVEIGRDLDAGAAGADDARDDVLDLLAQAPLVGDLALVGDRAALVVGGAVGEQAAGLVDDRDALGLEAVDGRGDQVADRPDLRGLEPAAHLEDDRGGRLDLVAREQRPLRHHQVDARGLHPVDRLDGARKLALERPQVIDVLNETGGAEGVGLVEDLVADAAALGQAGLGEAHPQPRHPVLRHHDDGPVIAQLVGDHLTVELLDDGGAVLHRQVGEQRGHLRRGEAQDDEGEEADQPEGHREHGGDPRWPQRLDEVDDAFHRETPGSPFVFSSGERTCPTRQVLPGSWFPSG